MSNIFSNLRWGILPLVLVTTTAMAMSTPASAMSTVNFSDSNLTHQEIKESLDNLKREHSSILNSDPRSSIEKALSPTLSIPSNPADGVNIGDINISLPKSDLASSSTPLPALWLLDLPRQFWQVLATQAFDALWGVDNHGKK